MAKGKRPPAGEHERYVFEPLLAPFGPEGLRPREVLAVADALVPGGELPSAYRAFLRIAGRGCGPLWVGSDWTYPRVLELREDTDELLAEHGHGPLAADEVPFLLHQGDDAWFLRWAGPDLEVWRCCEGVEEWPRRLRDSFTLFVQEEVRRLSPARNPVGRRGAARGRGPAR